MLYTRRSQWTRRPERRTIRSCSKYTLPPPRSDTTDTTTWHTVRRQVLRNVLGHVVRRGARTDAAQRPADARRRRRPAEGLRVGDAARGGRTKIAARRCRAIVRLPLPVPISAPDVHTSPPPLFRAASAPAARGVLAPPTAPASTDTTTAPTTATANPTSHPASTNTSTSTRTYTYDYTSTNTSTSKVVENVPATSSRGRPPMDMGKSGGPRIGCVLYS